MPSPRPEKARVAFRQDRILQASRLPSATTIHTDLDFGHAAAAAPGQSADLVKAGVNLLPPRGRGDHRLRLHHQAELIRLAVRHEIGVFGRLLTRHERSGAELQPPEPLHVDIAFIAGNEESQRSEEHTSELQSPCNLVCRLLLEKKKQSHMKISRSATIT